MTKDLFKLILDSNEYVDAILNWKDLLPVLKTNERYYTIIQANTISTLSLIGESADYVRNEYEQNGVLGSTTIQVKRYSNGTYEDFLIGELDYPSYDPDNDQMIVKIGIKETDFVSKWLNRDETETSLQELTDMDGNAITPFINETVDVAMHNQILDKKVVAGVNEPTLIPYFTVLAGQAIGDYDALERDGRHVIQLGTNESTINEIQDEYFSLPFGYVSESGNPVFNNLVDVVSNFISVQRSAEFNFDVDVSVDLSLDFDIVVSSNSGVPNDTGHIKFYYQRLFGLTGTKILTEVAVEDVNGWTNQGTDPLDAGRTLYQSTGSLSASFSLTLNSISGDDEGFVNEALKIFLEFQSPSSHIYFTQTSEKVDITINQLDVTVDRQVKYQETTCKSMLVYEAFLRSLQKMTGRNDVLRSTYYGRTDSEVHTYDEDGAGSLRAVANGFGVRQFPLAGHPIYTDFYKLFKSFNALDNIAVGVVSEGDTQYIAIEEKSFFKDATKIAFTLDNIKNFKELPSKKYLFSDAKFGNTKYEKQENGILRSPHTPRTYTTGLDQVLKSTYDVENPAICSGHLIEQLRQDPYVDGASKDSNYDNDLVIISVRRDGGDWRSEKGEDFDIIENIEYPDEQYNLKLTPLRRFKERHASLFGASLREKAPGLADSQVLRFQKGLGNTSLRTRIQTPVQGSVTENDLLSPLQLVPLIEGVNQTFEGPITQEQWKILLADPNQTIEAIWRGETYQGFVEMVKVDNPDDMKANFELIKVNA